MARQFNLKRLRTDLHLKQSELAEMLNIPQSSVSAMENGKTVVAPVYIQKIQKEYKITNIDDYFDEVEIVRIENNRGSNNGYKNVMQQGAIDADTIARIATIDSNLSGVIEDYRHRVKRLEQKQDELYAENQKLNRQLTEFMVLCAKNKIDFSDIIRP